jgi:hypothetical protein
VHRPTGIVEGLCTEVGKVVADTRADQVVRAPPKEGGGHIVDGKELPLLVEESDALLLLSIAIPTGKGQREDPEARRQPLG